MEHIGSILNDLLEAIDTALIEQTGLEGLPHDGDDKITEKEALLHRHGDTLRDFIVLELIQGCQGYSDDEIRERAVELLQSAEHEIAICIEAVLTSHDVTITLIEP
jgi:hypothetical protein